MRRRHALARAGLLGMAGLLSACGFALRRAPALPFARIALEGFAPASPLALELRRQLASTVQVVPATQAQVVLHALVDRRERSVAASTAAGQVRELTLRVLLRYRLATPAGRELIGPSELLQERDLTYSETLALAKAQEEAGLFAAMQADVVQQVLARLSRAPQP